MRRGLRTLSALVLVALVVTALGCGGRRGGRRAIDSGPPPADAGSAEDGGTARDGGSPPDGGGGLDAGPVDAGRDASEPPSVDVSGSWTGTWSSSGLSDSASASLIQTGSSVAGILSLNGSPCVTEGSVEATIMGSDVAGTFSSGTDSASFTAFATTSNLVGSFTFDTGSCAGVSGTVDLTR